VESTTKLINREFSFVETEREILRFWEKSNIFKKSLEQTKDGLPYVFYDGPPFATGTPHHGHLLASTIKDIIPRYFTMQGRYVQRRFGWDCHGLPIEHEIDKMMGSSAQDIVASLGLKRYNDECRKIVKRYAGEWETTITRLGRWVDFDNDYRTMEPWYMESVWWVFQQLWNKDLIYKGVKVVPFSTALGTVLSNFEAGSNYQDVQDPAVTVLFKLKDEDCYIAVWTTTPWTLPSNLGLCVSKDITYVKARDQDRDINIIVAKDCFDAVSKKKQLVVLEEFSGETLVGKAYTPLFNYFAHLEEEGAFRILEDNYVSGDSGTGIVHLAPAFGEDDFRVMKAADISAIVCPIDNSGNFTEDVTDFAGQHVKAADKGIIRQLKESGNLYQHDTLVHSYPFCPRSDTPIIYRTIPSWFIKVEGMRDDLVANNQEINWIPGHLKDGRMGNWLEGAVDWAISRNRYWGTPLPIWVNDKTDNRICIGSIDELKGYTGVCVTDLHRDVIDDLTFTIDGEEGTYKRISEVLDCWFESGAMPYAQIHYPFENEEMFENGFPAEFIAEGLDQTRGWFYTLSVLSNALYGKPAFKNVIVNGIVMAEDGKKMSKRLANYTPPDSLMEEHGADALRLYLINSGLVKGEAQLFSDKGVQDIVRRALLPWYNSFKFFRTYSDIDKWTLNSDNSAENENIMDQWILSRMESLKLKVVAEMESYKLYNVVPALFEFIEDLTNWYIRLNRPRYWTEEMTADKNNAYKTLYSCIYELSLAMAPFTPFLSEYIYLELRDTSSDAGAAESVHLCEYPKENADLIKPELEKAVKQLKEIVVLGRQKRNRDKVKTKMPLSKLVVIHKDEALLKEIKRLEAYLKAELNVKAVEYSVDESQYIDLYAKPNSPLLGKKLGKEFKKYKSLIEGLTAAEIESLVKEGYIEIEGQRFVDEEILIFRDAKSGTNAISNSQITIDLDCTLNDELIAEGLAREIVNRIQKTRKSLGFNVEDHISVTYAGTDKLEASINTFARYIGQETLADRLAAGEVSDKAIAFEIEGEMLKLDIALV